MKVTSLSVSVFSQEVLFVCVFFLSRAIGSGLLLSFWRSPQPFYYIIIQQVTRRHDTQPCNVAARKTPHAQNPSYNSVRVVCWCARGIHYTPWRVDPLDYRSISILSDPSLTGLRMNWTITERWHGRSPSKGRTSCFTCAQRRTRLRWEVGA